MQSLFLACGIWLAAFLMAMVGLVATESGDQDESGRIVLDDKPFCEAFVVQTERGFSLLDWDDGDLTFGETDMIVGPLADRGLHTFDVPGRGPVRARVVAEVMTIAEAEQVFRNRCGIDPELPLDRASVP